MSTKIQPPPYREGLLRRDRLLALLGAGRGRRLTVIHAPAGYGKTTLAMQWLDPLREEGVRTAWLSLDADDDSADHFIVHLLAAVRRVDPTVPAELMESQRQPLRDPTRDVLTDLLSHIASRGYRLVLVLDDWHLVSSPETSSLLDFLLANSPDLVHFVVISRTSSLAIGRLRVDDQVTEIDASLLRFDQRESADFLTQLKALPLDESETRQLWQKTEGWVAALQLATLSLRDSRDPTALIEGFSGRHRAVGDYLVENVLDSLDPQTLDVLLAVSIPDRIHGSLATALSGEPDGQSMLEDLEQQDMFLRALDDDREWFQFHQLFSAYLRRELERRSPERISGLHRTAAVWFAERDLLSEAVIHALATGDAAWAADLVESRAMDLVENSQMALLLALVGRLPRGLALTRPALQLAVGWANCLLQRLEPAQTALDLIRVAIDGDRDGSSQYLRSEVDVLQACVDVFRDRIDRAGALITPFLALESRHRPFLHAVAGNVQVVLDIHRCAFDAAQDRLAATLPYHAATDGPFSEVYGRSLAGLAAFAQLDLVAARQQYRDALDLAERTAGPRSHAARLAAALLGGLSYEQDRIDEADTHLTACYELGIESGLADFMIPAYTMLARVKVLRGDVDSAWEILHEGADAAKALRLSRLAAAVEHAQVQLHLMWGQPSRANDVIANSALEVPTGGDGISRSIRRHLLLMRARVAVAAGDVDQALRVIGRVRDDARGAAHPHDALEATLLLGSVQMAAGMHHVARATAAPALASAARAGLLRSVVDVGPGLRSIVGDLRDGHRRRNWPEGVAEVPIEYLSSLLATAQSDESRALSSTLERSAAGGTSAATSLNAREMHVLRQLERGLSNSEIAEGLGLTVNTVKWHLKNIYAKLGATRRVSAVAEARRLRLL